VDGGWDPGHGEESFTRTVRRTQLCWNGGVATVAIGEDDIVQTSNSAQSASQLQLVQIIFIKQLVPFCFVTL